MSKLIDITGQKFGMLTVIRRVENDRYNQTCWECKCDCGNKTIVKGMHLKSGRTKSCGCSKFEELRKKEIGKKYGMLTVIKVYEVENKKTAKYLCKCDCGNELINVLDPLRRGATVSCGCYSRKLAKEKQKKAAQVGRFEGTKIQNLTSKIFSSNTSGYKGIHRAKNRGKEAGWIVRITIKGERKYIGHFTDLEDAIKARNEAEEKYWEPILKEFYRGDINA